MGKRPQAVEDIGRGKSGEEDCKVCSYSRQMSSPPALLISIQSLFINF